MKYFVTRENSEIHPMVFSTQKAELMEEHLLMGMLEFLMKREYETYGEKTAQENINYQLEINQAFNGVEKAPKAQKDGLPSSKDILEWSQDLLYMTNAGQNLLNQVGAKLYPAKTEDEKWLTEEAMLSDLLGRLWTAEPDYQ